MDEEKTDTEIRLNCSIFCRDLSNRSLIVIQKFLEKSNERLEPYGYLRLGLSHAGALQFTVYLNNPEDFLDSKLSITYALDNVDIDDNYVIDDILNKIRNSLKDERNSI